MAGRTGARKEGGDPRGAWARIAVLALGLGPLTPTPVLADDIDWLPPALLDADPLPPTLPPLPAATAPGAAIGPAGTVGTIDRRGRWFVESALQGFAHRSGLILPLPAGTATPAVVMRTSLDLREEWGRPTGFAWHLSNRFSVLQQEGRPLDSRETLRNDFREAYAGWTPDGQWFLEAGRINLKSGIALGYNPTDLFKTDAVVTDDSGDPTARRDNRLGSVMVRGQHIGRAGTLTLALSPELDGRDQRPWTDAPGIGLQLQRTNDRNRALAKMEFAPCCAVTPELLLAYDENHGDGRTRIGTNVTASAGDAVVLYAEWMGGRRRRLTVEALDAARRRGGLPADAEDPTETKSNAAFRSEAVLGLSFAESEVRRTTYAEYHYNQAGLTGDALDRWFDPAGGAGDALLRAEYWTLREHAQEKGEKLARHSVFLRSQWEDAGMDKLTLTAMTDLALTDGSAWLQGSADYHLSDRWSFGLIGSATAGDRRSVYGSLSQAARLLVRACRYF